MRCVLHYQTIRNLEYFFMWTESIKERYSPLLNQFDIMEGLIIIFL